VQRGSKKGKKKARRNLSLQQKKTNGNQRGLKHSPSKVRPSKHRSPKEGGGRDTVKKGTLDLGPRTSKERKEKATGETNTPTTGVTSKGKGMENQRGPFSLKDV